MIPEEAFNQKLWHVLQRMQAERLLETDKEHIGYVLSNVIAPNVPSKDQERKIVLKLAQLHAVRIIRHTKTEWHAQNKEKFELEILLPKFDQLYKECQAACDPNASKSNYENLIAELSEETVGIILEIVKKLEKRTETTPTGEIIYFQVASYRDDGYDEQSLIEKLEEWGILTIEGNDEFGHPLILASLDKVRKLKTILTKAYEEKVLRRQAAEQAIRPSGTVHHKGQMFETGSGGSGYWAKQGMQSYTKPDVKEIVESFSSSNYPFVLMVLNKILSLSEFSSDDKVYYELQSGYGQGIIQERMFLEKLEKLNLFSNLGEDGINGIATLSRVDTKTIRGIIEGIEQKQSPTIPEQKSDGHSRNSSNLAQTPKWQDDFQRQGNSFIFGDIGEIEFGDTEAKRLFNCLFIKKGDWFKKREYLEEKFSYEYIRPTIRSINTRLKQKTNNRIKIVSTKSDETSYPKPETSAYRILVS